MKVWWSTLYKTQNFCLIILPMVIIDVRGSMKLLNEKLCSVFWNLGRIEADLNRAANELPETFSIMRIGVEVSKLHVRYFIYHFNFLEGEVHGEQLSVGQEVYTVDWFFPPRLFWLFLGYPHMVLMLGLLGNQLINIFFWYNFDLTLLCTLIFFMHCTWF